MRNWLSIALVCLWVGNTGCFIFDEIDQGQAQMRHHSPEGRGKKEASDEDPTSGLSLDSLRERGASVIDGLSDRVEEALARKPDPENVVVRCATESRIEFTRKFDCQSLGGRVLSR